MWCVYNVHVCECVSVVCEIVKGTGKIFQTIHTHVYHCNTFCM